MTADPRRARTSYYRIADNLLASWQGRGPVPGRDRARAGTIGAPGPRLRLGRSPRRPLRGGLSLPPAATRRRRRAGREGIVAIGPFWAEQPEQVEIDAVALAGRSREAVLVGESKWARREDAGRLCRALAAKAQALPKRAPVLRYAVCARERLVNVPRDALAVTAADIFRLRAA